MDGRSYFQPLRSIPHFSADYLSGSSILKVHHGEIRNICTFSSKYFNFIFHSSDIKIISAHPQSACIPILRSSSSTISPSQGPRWDFKSGGGGQHLIKFSENVSKKAILFNKISKSGEAMPLPPSNEGPAPATYIHIQVF